MEHTSDEILKLLDEKIHHIKSPEQLAPMVDMLFGNPNSLIEKITQFNTMNIKNNKQKQYQIFYRNKQFDIESIRKIYTVIKKHKLQREIAKSYMEIARGFEEPGRLQQFVKSQKQMRFFFIVILWQDLFTQPENRLLLLRMLNLINACPGYTHTFQSWCKQLDKHLLTLIVNQLHEHLLFESSKLPNTEQLAIIPFESDYVNKLWLNISNIGKFMNILYRANQQHKIVPKQIFIVPTFGKLFDSTMQYKLHYHKKTKLNMLSFPFLMPLDYKYQLIRIESILQQKLNIQRSMATGFSGMLNAMIQNNQFSMEGLIYLYIEVNRHDILNDSMEKLNKVKNLKAPLRISFVGEEGADEGGVKNQYFQLITKAIFNPYLDMFLPKHNGRVYWFNGFSYQPPIRFEFVGMLLGLAIYNSVHLQIPFPNVLYKKLLNKSQDDDYSPQLLTDLADIQPQIANSLKKILEMEQPLDDLDLYFTIELQSFGEKFVEQLVEQGRQIQLTQDNKHQYCQLYADYLLNKHIAKQFNAFKKGFYKVVSGKMIELLDSENLKTIIYGNDVIDFKELEETTNYQGGYKKDTPIIKIFWEILHGLELQEKKEFLIFATGSDRVPIQGMKELNFVIQRHANTSNLPTAHTCFNVFLLPEYESKEKLQKMIRLILQNNQGFGLI